LVLRDTCWRPGLLWALCLGPATAGTPLIYSGDQATASARAVGAGFAEADLEPTQFSELRGGVPVLLAGGVAEVCSTGRATRAKLEQALDDARSAILYGEHEAAAKALDDAAVAVLCAPDVPGAEAAAGLFLQGVLHHATGDEEASRDAFRLAVAADPALAWDDSFAPKVQEAFEAGATAARAGEDVSLGLYPGGDAVVLQLGQHIVAAGGVRVRVGLEVAGENTLVVPSAYADTLDASEGARGDLTRLLAAALGEGQAVLVAPTGELWSGTTGRVDWDQVVKVTPPEVPTALPQPPQPKKRKKTAAIAVTGLGAAVALGGGAWSARQYGRTVDAVDAFDPQTDTETTWGNKTTIYEVEADRLRLAYITTGVGAAILAGGLTFTVLR
jgi:hypothetical protein